MAVATQYSTPFAGQIEGAGGFNPEAQSQAAKSAAMAAAAGNLAKKSYVDVLKDPSGPQQPAVAEVEVSSEEEEAAPEGAADTAAKQGLDEFSVAKLDSKPAMGADSKHHDLANEVLDKLGVDGLY